MPTSACSESGVCHGLCCLPLRQRGASNAGDSAVYLGCLFPPLGLPRAKTIPGERWPKHTPLPGQGLKADTMPPRPRAHRGAMMSRHLRGVLPPSDVREASGVISPCLICMHLQLTVSVEPQDYNTD